MFDDAFVSLDFDLLFVDFNSAVGASRFLVIEKVVAQPARYAPLVEEVLALAAAKDRDLARRVEGAHADSALKFLTQKHGADQRFPEVHFLL